MNVLTLLPHSINDGEQKNSPFKIRILGPFLTILKKILLTEVTSHRKSGCLTHTFELAFYITLTYVLCHRTCAHFPLSLTGYRLYQILYYFVLYQNDW